MKGLGIVEPAGPEAVARHHFDRNPVWCREDLVGVLEAALAYECEEVGRGAGDPVCLRLRDAAIWAASAGDELLEAWIASRRQHRTPGDAITVATLADLRSALDPAGDEDARAVALAIDQAIGDATGNDLPGR